MEVAGGREVEPPKPKKLKKNDIISEGSIFSKKFSKNNKKFHFSIEFFIKNFQNFPTMCFSSKRAKN